MSTKFLPIILKALLSSAIIGFSLSTIWIYIYADTYRQELVRTVRLSGWISYQAQVEYLRLEYKIDLCLRGSCDIDDTVRQAEIFYSRIDVLANSEEGNSIQYIEDHRPRLQSIMNALLPIFNDIYGDQSIDGESVVRRIDISISDAGHLLQDIIRDAQLYNNRIERREFQIKVTDPAVPFSLLVASGLVLFLLLVREARARGEALRRVEALRDHENQLRQDLIRLLESLPFPIVVVADSGAIAYTNKAADQMFGHEQPGNVEAITSLLARLKGRDPDNLRLPLRTPSGQGKIFRCLVTSVAWGLGSGAICVLQDTEMEGDAQLQALSAGKVAVLGELSLAIAHEINQPLATIKAAVSNSTTLLSKDNGAEAVRSKLHKIDSQVDRIAGIVSRIRSLSTYGIISSRFSVDSAVENAIELISYQYRLSDILLEVKSAYEEPIFVYGDRTLLELSIANILLNARDAFMTSNTTPEVSRFVKISVSRGPTCATLEITDNAGGIDEAILPRIFDVFVSSKRPTGGTGIGMAITKRCIEGMRGRISATNLPDGARFFIEIPLHKDGVGA